MIDEQTLITPDGFRKLELELSERKTTLRRKISERIARAKEQGDLSENAEYTDARDQQAFNEGRILELEALVKRAVVVNRSNNSVVGLGSVIRVETEGQQKEFTVVGSEEADPLKGRISNESPLGQVFVGKKVGDVVELNLPRGIVRYSIVAIE